MPERVLVPIDGSPQAKTALEYALSQFPEAEIAVLHVVDPVETSYAADPSGVAYWNDWQENAERRAEELFEEAARTAEEHGHAITTATEFGRPARTIVEYAEEQGVDHVVMGSHGRSGVARILLGSVAETVVRRAPMPITVVR